MDKEPEGWSRDETVAAYERGVWTFLLFAGGGLIALVGWLQRYGPPAAPWYDARTRQTSACAPVVVIVQWGFSEARCPLGLSSASTADRKV
jgi:hypothetical protein